MPNRDIERLTTLVTGKFVVLDGPDGCGKSTQSKMLAEQLEAAGVAVTTCRDPGGTVISDRIRSILLDYDLSTMDVNCEALLFMASRAQLVAEIIGPQLDAGDTVICDRYVSSTCAYQGAAGYDPQRIIHLAEFAIGDRWPDFTVVLDIDTEEGFSRIGRKPSHAGKRRSRADGQAMLFEGSQPDAMEARSTEFHRCVRERFLALHEYYPRPVLTVDGRGEIGTVHQRIVEALTNVAC